MLAKQLTLEKKPIKGSAPETLFRVTLRNQLRTIGIADQKAKVIIGINTILISLFIGLTGIMPRVTAFYNIQNLNLSLPTTVMILACFASAALAIMVVRPDKKLWSNNNPSKLAFRDFNNTDLDDFVDEMLDMLGSKKSIYSNLSTDLYLYGKCLQKKNMLLRYAYNVFLGGLTVAVLSFIVLKMTAPDAMALISIPLQNFSC